MKKIYNLLLIFTLVLVGGLIGASSVNADSTVLYNDGTLIINERDEDREVNTQRHNGVSDTYTPFSNENNYVFANENEVLWSSKVSNIRSVEIGQTIRPTSTAYWFYGMTKLSNGDFSNLDTSDVTDMKYMFYNSTSDVHSFNSANWSGIEDFVTSKVTNMSHAIGTAYWTYFLKDWDTSSVTDMSYMFEGNEHGAKLPDWNVSNVTTMSGMFKNATGAYDFSNWDTSNVTDMSYMFANDSIYPRTYNIIEGKLKIPDNCNVDHFATGYEVKSLLAKFLIEGTVLNYENMFTSDSVIGLYYNNSAGSNMIDTIISAHSQSTTIYKNPYEIKVDNESNITPSQRLVPSGTVITITPKSDYLIKTITVKTASDENVEFNYENNTFVMPSSDVNISATLFNKNCANSVRFQPRVSSVNRLSFSWDGGWVGVNPDDLDYELYMKKTSDSNYTYVGQYKHNGSSINDLTPGEKYKFKTVISVTLNGVKTVLNTKESGILTMPNELSGTMNLTSKLVDYSEFYLEWNEITGAEGYKIYYKEKNANSYQYGKSSTSNSTNLKLDYNKEYYIKVVPYQIYYPAQYTNIYEYNTDLGGEKLAKTKPRVINAGIINIEKYLFNNTRFSWAGNQAADYYKVFYKTSSDSDYTLLTQTTNKYYEKKDLIPMETYYFKVVACVILNDMEVQEPNGSIFDIKAEIDPPSQIDGKLQNQNSVKVTWSKANGVTGYYLYYKKVSDKNYKYLNKTKELSYTVNNLEYNTKYIFKLVPYVLYQNKDRVSDIYDSVELKTGAKIKAKNPMIVKAVNKKVKYKKVKKKKQVITPIVVTKAQGKVTYAKVSGNKKFKVDKTTGKITVKKKTKKGTYYIKVKVTAAGNKNFKAKSTTVTFKVKVK